MTALKIIEKAFTRRFNNYLFISQVQITPLKINAIKDICISFFKVDRNTKEKTKLLASSGTFKIINDEEKNKAIDELTEDVLILLIDMIQHETL